MNCQKLQWAQQIAHMLHEQSYYPKILRLLNQNVKKNLQKISCAKIGFVISAPTPARFARRTGPQRRVPAQIANPSQLSSRERTLVRVEGPLRPQTVLNSHPSGAQRIEGSAITDNGQLFFAGRATSRNKPSTSAYSIRAVRPLTRPSC